MIHQIKGYVAECDECGTAFSFNDSEQSVFDDAFVAEQIIKDQGWRKVNGQLLCEDCYEEYMNNEQKGGEQ